MGDRGKSVPVTTKDLEFLDGVFMLERFFSVWPPSQIPELLPGFQVRSYSRGETIVKEGESGTELFILYKGKATVERNKLIGSDRLATLEPGDFFGEIGFLEQKARSATVKAMGETHVFCFTKADMDKIFEQNIGNAQRIEAIAKERLAKTHG